MRPPRPSRPAEDNACAQALLHDELDRRSLAWWPAAGGDAHGTHIEQSVAIAGLSDSAARELGRCFGQEAGLRLDPRRLASAVLRRRRDGRPGMDGVHQQGLELRHLADRLTDPTGRRSPRTRTQKQQDQEQEQENDGHVPHAHPRQLPPMRQGALRSARRAGQGRRLPRGGDLRNRPRVRCALARVGQDLPDAPLGPPPRRRHMLTSRCCSRTPPRRRRGRPVRRPARPCARR
ncbi:DUF3293 domain-containing protein [Streptomyces sp. NPDC005507]|uniref:DUF3293 domain-containing protein n=1 Tax=Streptomyces sp. NPDC005507 TaxID=3154885 RepID=UPI0033AECED5